MTEEEIRDALESGDLRKRVGLKAAGVFIYLLRLADVCGFDLVAEAANKVEVNRNRYPAELARGNARKYDNLKD